MGLLNTNLFQFILLYHPVHYAKLAHYRNIANTGVHRFIRKNLKIYFKI